MIPWKGSIAKKGDGNDIDLALIIDDNYRIFGNFGLESLDYRGIPYELTEGVNELKARFKEKFGVPFDLLTYWESEYENGIELGRDSLNETGIEMYKVA